MVLVGPSRADFNPGIAVGCDLDEGGFLAGRHLIATGRRRLVCLVDSLEKLAEGSKAAGFRRAVKEDAEWVEYMAFDSGDAVACISDGLTDAILERFADVDGIFALSDVAAMPMVRRLLERGRRVPWDIAVVGFDDLPQARYAAVPLTTIRQPIARYAQIAVDLLMDQLKCETTAGVSHRLPCQLIVRESTDGGWKSPATTRPLPYSSFAKGMSR